jgi:hypothetical protein
MIPEPKTVEELIDYWKTVRNVKFTVPCTVQEAVDLALLKQRVDNLATQIAMSAEKDQTLVEQFVKQFDIYQEKIVGHIIFKDSVSFKHLHFYGFKTTNY